VHLRSNLTIRETLLFRIHSAAGFARALSCSVSQGEDSSRSGGYDVSEPAVLIDHEQTRRAQGKRAALLPVLARLTKLGRAALRHRAAHGLQMTKPEQGRAESGDSHDLENERIPTDTNDT
jgi:hypothetical protein